MAKREYYDWEQALKPFHKRLVQIGEHIQRHNLISATLDIAAEVAEADRLYREWRVLEHGVPSAAEVEEYNEEWARRWWAYWIYVGEHIHRWWD